MSSNAEAAHSLIAAEAFLGRSENYTDDPVYPAQATAAALISIAYTLGRIADALEREPTEGGNDARAET